MIENAQMTGSVKLRDYPGDMVRCHLRVVAFKTAEGENIAWAVLNLARRENRLIVSGETRFA